MECQYKYTKHKVIRVKDLTPDFFELVIQRDRITFNPGDRITFMLPGSQEITEYAASEPECGWLRIILNKAEHPFPAFQDARVVKVLGVKPCVPGISPDMEVFVVTGSGIGAYFSFVSTFPSVRTKVYLSGGYQYPNLEWIRANHQILDGPPQGPAEVITRF